MRYLLLIYGDEAVWAEATPEEMEATMAAHGSFSEATGAEGILRGGEAPFAEAREQLGGFYLVECDTLDQAIGAARRVPEARYGAVEVRPLMEFDG